MARCHQLTQLKPKLVSTYHKISQFLQGTTTFFKDVHWLRTAIDAQTPPPREESSLVAPEPSPAKGNGTA